MTEQARSDLRAARRADISGLATSDRRWFVQSLDLAGSMDGMFHEVTHRDGIPWDQAPVPPRWHTCTFWTTEWFGLSQVIHCACGARMGNIAQQWYGKNSRRRADPIPTPSAPIEPAAAPVRERSWVRRLLRR